MRIIVAIDGTDCSDQALDFVSGRRWGEEDEFLVLCVAEPAPGVFEDDEEEAQCSSEMLKDCGVIAERGLKRLQRKLSSQSMSTLVVCGSPPEAIVERAASWPADLIVLGSHGHSGCRRFMVGSVAETVLKQAPCSVQVVRIQEVEK
ncbi:MAG: universal stress protein [Cyanobacteria bacterium HKST-UBA02]|nr:universal stress protein [Cyanobacteria bacterium HKST-UBA02]